MEALLIHQAGFFFFNYFHLTAQFVCWVFLCCLCKQFHKLEEMKTFNLMSARRASPKNAVRNKYQYIKLKQDRIINTLILKVQKQCNHCTETLQDKYQQ